MMRLIRSGGMVLVWWSVTALIAVVLQPADHSQSMLRVSHLALTLHPFAALLALWVAFGRSSRRSRAFGLFAGAMVVAVGFSLFGEWPDYWYLLIAAVAQVSATFGCGLILRGIWAGVATLARAESTNPAAPPPMSFRWTIRDLALSIAAIAAILTPLTAMRPIARDFGQLPVQVVNGLTLALVSLATAWAASRRSIWPSGLLTLLLCVASAVILQVSSYEMVFKMINYEYYIGIIGYSVLVHVLVLFVPLKLIALHGPALVWTEADSPT